MDFPPRNMEFFGVVHQLLPMAASAVGAADIINVDGQADFLIDKQAAIYDNGQAKLRFQVGSVDLMQDVPHYVSALGSGAFPNVLPAPYVVPRASQFAMIGDDRQTVPAANNIRVLHIGRKYFDRPFQSARSYSRARPMRLIANFTADDGGAGVVAANGTGQFAVAVPSSWDFEIRKVALLADGDFTLQVSCSGKSLDWFNRACHSALLGATGFNAAITSGEWPFILPAPVMVRSIGTIQVQVADLSAVANRIMIVFQGLRLEPPFRG